MKNICKRFMAVVLATATLLCGIPLEGIYAQNASSHPTGDTETIPPTSSNGPCLYGGALIFDISTMENAYANSTKDIPEAVSKAGEANATLVANHLYTYPTYIYEESNPKNQFLLLLATDATRKTDRKYKLITASGEARKSPFSVVKVTRTESKKVHHKNSDGSIKPIALNELYDWVSGNDERFNKFGEGKLTLAEVQTWYTKHKNTTEWKNQVNDFVACWDYTEEGALAIRQAFKEAKDSTRKALKYLELLVVLNELCGGNRWKQIETYLQNLNADGSSKFVNITIAAGVCWGYYQGDSSGSTRYIYPLPVYYALCDSSKDVSKYTTIGNPYDTKKYTKPEEELAHYNDLVAQGKANDMSSKGLLSYATAIHKTYNNKLGNNVTGDAHFYGTNKDILWWLDGGGAYGNLGTAIAVTPTNLAGKSTGNVGYTFITKSDEDKPSKSFEFTDSIESVCDTSMPMKFTSKETADKSAIITSTVKTVATDVNTKLAKSIWNKCKAKKVTVTIKLKRVLSKGYSDSAFIDKYELPAGAAKYSATKDGSLDIVTFEFTNLNDFVNFLKGKETFKIYDKVSVKKNLANTIITNRAKVIIEYDVGYKTTGTGTGKYVDSDDNTWCYDTAEISSTSKTGNTITYTENIKVTPAETVEAFTDKTSSKSCSVDGVIKLKGADSAAILEAFENGVSKATITINVARVHGSSDRAVSLTNTKIFDSMTGVGTDKIKSDSGGNAQIKFNVSSANSLAGWLTGSKSIKFTDTGISMKYNTSDIVNYLLTTTVELDNGKSITGVPKGTHLRVNDDGSMTAYDYSTFKGKYQEVGSGYDFTTYLTASADGYEWHFDNSTQSASPTVTTRLTMTAGNKSELQQIWSESGAAYAKAVVSYGYGVDEDSMYTSRMIDSISGGGLTCLGVAMKSAEYERRLNSVDDIQNWLGSTITTKDTGFRMTGNLDGNPTYYAEVDIELYDSTDANVRSLYGRAKGKLFDERSDFVAVDRVNLFCDTKNIIAVDDFSYSSNVRTPYVEVKSNSPDNEKFEAMAGIPTTENMYAGFGAQEFDVSLEGRYQTASPGTRYYHFTYVVPNCSENNEKCSYYCPGHSCQISGCGRILKEYIAPTPEKSHKDPVTGATIIDQAYDPGQKEERCTTGAVGTLKCDSNGGATASLTLVCGCGHYSKTFTMTPTYGPGHSQCKSKKDGSLCCDGSCGCKHVNESVINECHTHEHTFTATVKQTIDPYTYLNITNYELYRMNKAEFSGNPLLFSNPNQSIDPGTGWFIYANCDDYANQNGRLKFDQTYNTQGETWGDTRKPTQTDSKILLHTEADQAATKWFNDQIRGVSVGCTVISDYLVMQSTYGYQVACYNQYKSKKGKLDASQFTTGSDSKTINAQNITFDRLPTFDELWTNNGYTASTWNGDTLVRSGYNGQYSNVTGKYDNPNSHVVGTDPTAALCSSQPQSTRHPATGFAGQHYGMGNQYMTIKGLNIIDSTTDNDQKYWDPYDNLHPVTNGQWSTGSATVNYEMVANLGQTKRTQKGFTYSMPVGYTGTMRNPNDIVIHDPVAVSYSTLIGNDAKYDLRTDTSLTEDKSETPDLNNGKCPGDSTCAYCTLHCTCTSKVHDDSCYVTLSPQCTGTMNTHVCGDECAGGCTHRLNAHVCTSECTSNRKVLSCTDPHHYSPGQSWDPNNTANHWPYGDLRCWQPCNNDENHKNKSTIVVNGQTVQTSGQFINLDRSFKIHCSNVGDFQMNPNLHGIGTCTDVLGMGYTNNMDTSRWVRSKFVTFAFDVNATDKNGQWHTYPAGTPIPLYDFNCVTGEPDTYEFYVPLSVTEASSAELSFNTIAVNAPEEIWVDDNRENTNKIRHNGYAADHNAYKKQWTDIVGYIGSLTIEDTGDFRFATLFKQSKNDGTWLIKGLVPSVVESLPNKIVSDSKDVRQENAVYRKSDNNNMWNYHSVYGNTYQSTGGKSFDYVSLPLTAQKNPVSALQTQSMRPGYSLYMDVETVGNYFGETKTEDGTLLDTNLIYKMQITPKYWALNLDTGVYTPLDIYMDVGGIYKPIQYFDENTTEARLNNLVDYTQYLDWANEYDRRNYTENERIATANALTVLNAGKLSETPASRTVSATKDPIGTAQRLFLNDKDRTFIGSSKTYGISMNPDNILDEKNFNVRSQRWHFTLGLPSSTVFIASGKECSTTNIEEIQNMNAVVVCAIDIKVKGDRWTLEYDGKSVNNANGGGFQPYPGGPTYQPPKDSSGKPIDDPIVVVYSNKDTSADDLRTEGSH